MKKTNKKINSAILIIGNEILSGRTQDLNVSFLSNWLNQKCGISVLEVRVIPDIEKIIVRNVLELKKNYHYVFTTGGIGHTLDDITGKSLSKALNVKYEYHVEAYKILENYYGKKHFNDGRKKMAKMPRGSNLIYNPASAAPGFIIKNIIVLPGVPSILKSMIDSVKKYLKKGSATISHTISLHTIESNISKKLAFIQKTFIKNVDIGSYPFFRLGKVGVSIVLRSTSRTDLNKCLNKIKIMIKDKKIKIYAGTSIK